MHAQMRMLAASRISEAPQMLGTYCYSAPRPLAAGMDAHAPWRDVAEVGARSARESEILIKISPMRDGVGADGASVSGGSGALLARPLRLTKL